MPLICSLHSLPLKWLPLPSRKLRLFDCFPCCDPLGGKVAALQKRKNKTQKTVNVNDNFFFFLNTVGVIYVTWHIVSTVRNSCWRSLKILGKWGFSWRTLKRRREINLGPPRSVPLCHSSSRWLAAISANQWNFNDKKGNSSAPPVYSNLSFYHREVQRLLWSHCSPRQPSTHLLFLRFIL